MTNKPSIVLGTWSWGTGVAGGDQVFGNHLGEKELRPVFEEAMKNGLNLWDSAVVYGMGASETLLSTFTREYPRNEVLVSTKFTPQIANEKAENPVAEMLEGSLNRFGTDYIDIYWIHNPADVERWTPYLVPLVKKGKSAVWAFPIIIWHKSSVRKKSFPRKVYMYLACRTITVCFTARLKRQASWITAMSMTLTFGPTWCWNREF